MPDIHACKAALRSALRQHRKSLDADQQRAAARALVESVVRIPTWASAQRVAVYLASDGEIDTAPVVNIARSQHKQLFLPVVCESCEGNSLRFTLWENDSALAVNRYNIPEPPADAEQSPASGLDLILLPLVGWDLQGGRLGMGGGYYDRALSGVCGPLLVGLAHDTQRVDHIPRESWDIVLDYVATDAALYCTKEG